MVKYGLGSILCQECESSIIIKTQIQNDNNWQYNILSKSCDHFYFIIDVYTKNTFTPFGDPDEIRFDLKAECKVCNTYYSLYSFCNTNGNIKNENKICTCHGNNVQFDTSFWPNGYQHVYENNSYANKFSLIKYLYLSKLIFDEKPDYKETKELIFKYQNESVFLPVSNSVGEIILPDGKNYPYSYNVPSERRSLFWNLFPPIFVSGNHNINSQINLTYANGKIKIMLHSLVAVFDKDLIEDNNLLSTICGWDSNGNFIGDEDYFHKMAKIRKFSTQIGYTDCSVRIDVVGFLKRNINGVDVKYANIQIKLGCGRDSCIYALIELPLNIFIGRYNIRNLFVESINSCNTVTFEPYKHHNGFVFIWRSFIKLIKSHNKILWYFKILHENNRRGTV